MNRWMPTGTVTLMFTDIEGSTKLWEELGAEIMLSVLEAHNAILRQAMNEQSGYEVRSEGDAFFFAFQTATDAVQCAVKAQLALSQHPWPEATGSIRVRMGVHTGDIAVLDGDYQGAPANIAKRIEDAGHGGQILVSAATHELVKGQFPASWFLDLGMHRLRNLQQRERIFQIAYPELQRDFPPLRTLDGLPNNLPVQLTSFIGREAEIRKVAELLGKEQVRLVTLTGAGGIGKTRLSIEVAAGQLDRFPDGVWFIPLASLTDPVYIITEIASSLSIQLQPNADPRKQLIDYLSQKHLLLVLDNFEHLYEAASVVTDLLRGAPSLHCLVTSRELLHVSGEQLFPVPPLSSPSEGVDIETLSQYESVRLFIERAQAVKPDFQLTPQNAAIISSICHHLDGIPLAIELAAARVRQITLQQILEYLPKQLEFLTTRRRDVPSRHQTLRAAMDWSYELLGPDEQKLFAQLSIFSGGFFLEAVEAICEIPGGFELVLSLQDKSLLTVDEVMEQTRYGMLQPLREYAKEKLGEDVELSKAHAEYYLAIAQTHDQRLQSAEQILSLSLMALELDNFRSAMDFAQEQEEWKLSGELAVALSEFFDIRGFWPEGIQRLRQAEETLRSLQESALLAKVLNGLGKLHRLRGNHVTAYELYTEALHIRRELGDKQGIADSLNDLGVVAARQGVYDEARRFYTESLKIRRESGDRQSIASSLNNLGNLAAHQGAYDEAKRFITESLQMQRELGDRQGTAISLNNLGNILGEQGVYDEAKELYTESLRIRRQLGNKQGIADSLANLGNIADCQGSHDEAREFFTQSLQIRRELNDKQGIAASLGNLGIIAHEQEDYSRARQFYTESLKTKREIGDKRGITYSLTNLGVLAEDQGHYDKARWLHTESLEIQRELGDKRAIANSLANLGVLTFLQGAYDEARQFYTESLKIRRGIGDKAGVAESLHGFGKIVEAEGNLQQAASFFLIAAGLYEEMKAANSMEAKEVQKALAGIQKEAGAEQFEQMKQQARAMSVKQVIELALY